MFTVLFWEILLRREEVAGDRGAGRTNANAKVGSAHFNGGSTRFFIVPERHARDLRLPSRRYATT